MMLKIPGNKPIVRCSLLFVVFVCVQIPLKQKWANSKVAPEPRPRRSPSKSAHKVSSFIRLHIGAIPSNTTTTTTVITIKLANMKTTPLPYNRLEFACKSILDLVLVREFSIQDHLGWPLKRASRQASFGQALRANHCIKREGVW